MVCCDICNKDVTSKYIDGRTTSGQWGNMCLQCHKVHGVGLGIGKGQLIEGGVVTKGGRLTGG